MPLGAAKIAYQGYQVVAAAAEPGSLLFDGTGDVINAGTTVLPTGTTATWTVECWFRQSATQASTKYFFSNQGSSGQDIAMFIRTDNQIGLFINSTVTGFFSGTGYIQNDTWHHLAWTRNGNTVAMYIDGVQRNTTTTGSTFTTDTSTLRIGAQTATGTNSLNGHMDLIRISDTVRYTGNFSPAADFSDDANTLLLIKADDQSDGSTTITDSSGNETLTAVNDAQIDTAQYYDVNNRDFISVEAIGDAQVDTAQSKFGGASALFDGTGDYLTAAMPDQGTGDWTVECWVYATSWTGQNHCVYADPGNAQAFIDSSGRIAYYRGSTTTGTTTLNTSTWYHVSWTRASGVVYMHINGTYEAQRGDTTNHNGDRYIGVNVNGSGAYWNGHIDEWRFSDGNRYSVTTGNYTAPSAAFTNDADTVLLLHMNGTDGSTMFRDDNG